MRNLMEDDRSTFGPRYFTFLGIMMALMLIYPYILAQFFPPKEQPQTVATETETTEPGDQPDAVAGDSTDASSGETGEPPEVSDSPDAAESGESQPSPELPPAPEAIITLGSLETNGPYRMLVTLTSRGAAVERVEFSSRKYLDLEDRSGYLGELGDDDDVRSNGFRVRVVGPGTPAADAGLRPGDVIVSVDNQKVVGRSSLDAILRKTIPGQEVTIRYRRDGKELETTAVLRRRPLSVIRPEGNDPLSFLTTLAEIDDQNLLKLQQSIREAAQKNSEPNADIPADITLPQPDLDVELAGVDLRHANWYLLSGDADPDDPSTWPTSSPAMPPEPRDEAVFAAYFPKAKLVMLKRYRLASVAVEDRDDGDHGDYHLTLDIEIHNLDSRKHTVAYQLDGPTGLPTEGYWYARKMSNSWGAVGLRDIAFKLGDSTPQLLSCHKIAKNDWGVPWKDDVDHLTAIGVDAQYFSAILLPQKKTPEDVWFTEAQPLQVGPANKKLLHLTDTSCRLTSISKELAPGETFAHSYRVFIGPKREDLLAAYDLNGLVQYGWFWFVAQPMSRLLHFFHDYFVFNYGLAIILLTVLVRGCMFPISRKQTLNMIKQRELQPEIKRIQETYKDMEERNRAMQELWRKHNFNPFSGCLVMFIQIPIFFGLYKALAIDVELRQSPLFSEAIRWCSNLAAPDMLFNWSFLWPDWFNQGQGLFGLGPYFNLLPIVTIAFFLWQQKVMMPPPADEQAQMQQRMMTFMMIFMGILFYKVASGLCLYFIASSAWGMAERKLLPKAPDKTSEKKPATSPVESAGKRSGTKAPRAKVDGKSNPTVQKIAKWLDEIASPQGRQDTSKPQRKKKHRKR
ncbi:YidC/Oxa1 family insertase periplasmic-domain containing protein [Thermostilla marina]